MKNNIQRSYLPLLLLLLFFPSCKKAYFADCKESHYETCLSLPFRYENLEKKESGLTYDLPPLMDFENIIEYSKGKNSASENILLRVIKFNNQYLLQLVQERRRGWEPEMLYYSKVTEKVLTKTQEKEMLFRILAFKCAPCDLDRHLTIMPVPHFSLIIKKSEEVKVFLGVPYDISMDKEGHNYINQDKVKILDFIGFLLRIGGASSETIYCSSGSRVINDSLDYQINLSPGTMIREEKVYIDGQLIKTPMYHRIAVSDTANLRERIKIISTEWDNVVMEY